MATRTISNAGGNYNSTATWVEGIVPTSADDIVATATSGQLTVNVASAAASFNFTNYTNTLTVNALWTVAGTSKTQTFVSGMTIAGTNYIYLNSATTIVTNGLTIPNLRFGTGNKTLNDNLNTVNFWCITGISIIGTRTWNNSGDWLGNGITVVVGTDITLNLTGTGTITGMSVQFDTVNINTSGTLTLVLGYGVAIWIKSPANNQPAKFNYISGTITGDTVLRMEPGTHANSLFYLDVAGINWKQVVCSNVSVSVNLHEITLLSDLNFDKLNLGVLISSSINTAFKYRITGPGRLVGGKVNYNTAYGLPLLTTLKPNLELGSTASHVVEQLYAFCDDGEFGSISSQTASTTAYFGVTSTQSIANIDFTDIDASAGPISVFRSNLTRTTAITNYNTLSGGGGVSGGSWTFVN